MHAVLEGVTGWLDPVDGTPVDYMHGVLEGTPVDYMHGVLEGVTGWLDPVEGTPVDYMHGVLEGVTGWLLHNWSKSENHSKPYYLGM